MYHNVYKLVKDMHIGIATESTRTCTNTDVNISTCLLELAEVPGGNCWCKRIGWVCLHEQAFQYKLVADVPHTRISMRL